MTGSDQIGKARREALKSLLRLCCSIKACLKTTNKIGVAKTKHKRQSQTNNRKPKDFFGCGRQICLKIFIRKVHEKCSSTSTIRNFGKSFKHIHRSKMRKATFEKSSIAPQIKMYANFYPRFREPPSQFRRIFYSRQNNQKLVYCPNIKPSNATRQPNGCLVFIILQKKCFICPSKTPIFPGVSGVCHRLRWLHGKLLQKNTLQLPLPEAKASD